VEEILGRGRIGDGTIYVSAFLDRPGVVVHAGGPGRVVLGRNPEDVDALSPHRDLLAGAGIGVELVADVEPELWAKYSFLCALAGATALHGEPLGPILANEGKRRLVEALIQEVGALARARGVTMPQDVVARNLAICRAFPPETKSSLLHDLENGRRHELDWLLGTAVELAGRLGVPLPITRQTYQGIRARWRLAG
jgi:2-dehydropantoate 2-reductase